MHSFSTPGYNTATASTPHVLLRPSPPLLFPSASHTPVLYTTSCTHTSTHTQALAAENVALENQLLEVKSSQLRHEKQAAAAAAAAAKLEAQLAKLTSVRDESSAELSALTAERRILKARLMQAEARMRAGGLEPLPPMPTSIGAAGGRVFFV